MSLLKVVFKGISWSAISSVVRSLVSLIQVSILTRYLPVEDFGLIAIATFFVGFAQIFMDMGISNGIMHKQDTTRSQYCSLFWLNIGCGFFLFAMLWTIAPIVSHFYGDDTISKIIKVLCFGIFFSSLGNQQKIVLQKQLRFLTIASVEILSSIFALIITFILVNNGFGIYSLVIPQLLNIAIPSILFFIIGLIKTDHIYFHFNFKETYPYLKIGSFSVGSNVLSFFSREIDIVILGSLISKESLGIYSLCKKLVVAIYNAINPISTRVLMPVFASIQSEKSRLKETYYNVVETNALFNIPIYLFVGIFAYGIITYLYGSEYTVNSSIMTILSIQYLYLATCYPIGSLMVALGRTDLCLYWNVFQTIIFSTAVFVGSFFSLTMVAALLSVFSFLTMPFMWQFMLKPTIGGSFKDLVTKIIPQILYGVLIATFFYVCFSKTSNLIIVITMGIAFVVLFCVGLFLLFKNSYIVLILRSRIIPFFLHSYAN